jgi:hypothetical protein
MTPLDRDRFAKVLGMLASPHAGEVRAAAKAAVRFLNAADATWQELLVTKEPQGQELLVAKIHALQASNRRLRSENHQLRIQAKRTKPSRNHRVRIFLTWLVFVFAIGLFVFVAVN